jgi:hypothetical protein
MKRTGTVILEMYIVVNGSQYLGFLSPYLGGTGFYWTNCKESAWRMPKDSADNTAQRFGGMAVHEGF